jgi:hypothetical protein
MAEDDVSLPAFLSRAAARGFRWGKHDCMLFAADWVLALTGRDPAAAWRGTYFDEASAAGIVAWNGGEGALLRRGLEAAGGWQVADDEPREGDIVLVRLPNHAGMVAAGIGAGGGKVATLTRTGLVVWPANEANVRAVWRRTGQSKGRVGHG